MTNQSITVVSGVLAAQNAVDQICTALDTLETIKETFEAQGIVLSDFDADIQAHAQLGHCPTATYNYIITDVASTGIVAALKAFYSGTPTAQGWSALLKARKL